jgi:hypothetical protein
VQPVDVAQQGVSVGGEMVGEQDGLRVLQVRAPGHRGVGVRSGLGDQRVDDVQHTCADPAGSVAQPHPEQRGHLVVARAPGAELAAQLGAGPFDQAPLQRRVHVLVVGRGSERAGLHVGLELGQRVEHARELAVGEQARAGEHAGVRHRAAQVVRSQPPVEVRGLG